MLKIKSSDGEISVKASGEFSVIMADLICAVRGFAESVRDNDERNYEVLKLFFRDNHDDLYKMVFEPDKIDFEKAGKKVLVKKIVKMAEETLVDDEDDEIGKKLVAAIREMAEQAFCGDKDD